MTLRTIKLYGALGKKFGKEHQAHVESVGEAIRFLSANFKDFGKYIVSGSPRLAGYEVWDGKYNLAPEAEDFNKLGDGVIKIIPRARGSGAGARIILGAVLMVVGYIFTPVTAGGSLVLSSWGGMMMGMGASLVLGGVIELLSPKSNLSAQSAADSQESYIFSGATNSSKIGNPVAIGYGKMTVGSQVISGTITTHDIAVS
jgi:predicted phage tail protein